MKAKELIRQLGGAVSVASSLGLKAKIVYNWSDRGRIPFLWERRLVELAAVHGITSDSVRSAVIGNRRIPSALWQMSQKSEAAHSATVTAP